jgi:hypothetical protein
MERSRRRSDPGDPGTRRTLGENQAKEWRPAGPGRRTSRKGRKRAVSSAPRGGGRPTEIRYQVFLCLNPPGDPLTLAQQEIGVLSPAMLYSIPQLFEPPARGRHLGTPPPPSRTPRAQQFSCPHDPVPATRPNQAPTPPPILSAPDPRGDLPSRRSHLKQRPNHHAPGPARHVLRSPG